MKEEPISSLFDVASFFSHMGYSKYHLFLQSYSIYRCFFFILKIEKKKKDGKNSFTNEQFWELPSLTTILKNNMLNE